MRDGATINNIPLERDRSQKRANSNSLADTREAATLDFYRARWLESTCSSIQKFLFMIPIWKSTAQLDACAIIVGLKLLDDDHRCAA